MRFVFDMETSDPDDYITLLVLLAHPAVELCAVTVTPGTPHQIAVVRHALAALERQDVRVGAFNLDHGKPCVSSWHHLAYGLDPEATSREAEPGWTVLADALGPDTTLVTGAPLKNVGALLRRLGAASPEPAPEPGSLGRLFVQGGFAGDEVVPPEDRLAKFAGLTTCPSFNLNGDPRSALLVVERARWFSELRFVSKNVCHGVTWDDRLAQATAARIAELPDGRWRRALDLVARGLDGRQGKALHDPFAACCALDPGIARWAEVAIYRAHGEWGARLEPGSPIRIVTGYDRARFERVLLAR